LYNQAIFNDVKVEHISFEVKCQYVEIYNETIFDLLDNQGTNKLQIREKDGITFLSNVTEMNVVNISEVLSLIKKGQTIRKVAATNMNKESSRSHAVFTAFIRT
jgi:kinesin family protein 15